VYVNARSFITSFSSGHFSKAEKKHAPLYVFYTKWISLTARHTTASRNPIPIKQGVFTL
jgi:hypothetical protein